MQHQPQPWTPHTPRRTGALRQNTSLLQERLQLALLVQGLNLRVSTDVLLANVDVGHGALAVELLKGVLKGATIIYCLLVSTRSTR